eukprot:CAMPEP_0172506674 /NCGR_PEP_ID=MMETSP1066-20121228/197213_1 /TAXON_ID=671091 /ORGANISM="Coscinodiscus wailesii, Strain CCMP2513" /LENGTH=90 /DNA_ID=CAMNT_0013283809 /DNA_START=85 /DNA_END=353 /DNA_ORIENTATION=-
MSWTAPDCHSSSAADGTPCPRDNHTASLVNNWLYVFGGHGGDNYRRNNLNDLWVLDMSNSWSWGKVNTSVTGPEPRAGHSACVVGTTIFV